MHICYPTLTLHTPHHTPSRALSAMDKNGDKTLTREELKTGLASYGIQLNTRQTDDIFHFFEKNRDGVVGLLEFTTGVGWVLNKRRRGVVGGAYRTLCQVGVRIRQNTSFYLHSLDQIWTFNLVYTYADWSFC
jgi:hypothetical protein